MPKSGDPELAILATARAEFLKHGHLGTNASRIARRAGLAPGTFYRFFKDLTDVFVAVYVNWAAGEQKAFARLMFRKAPVSEFIDAWIERQRQHRALRRSLGVLAEEDPRVRRAQAEHRLDMVAAVLPWTSGHPSQASLAIDLILAERLADAIADGELKAMGLDDAAAVERLEALIGGLRNLHGAAPDVDRLAPRPPPRSLRPHWA
jgi:AcrR family transcriptional regulator